MAAYIISGLLYLFTFHFISDKNRLRGFMTTKLRTMATERTKNGQA